MRQRQSLSAMILSLLIVVAAVVAAVEGFSHHMMTLPSSSSRMIVPTSLLRAASSSWEVYVDQSSGSLDKGGGATLDAFLSLAPSNVQVRPAVFKTKSKGPAVRCISTSRGFDVGNVDSVDKVYRILSKHMEVQVCLLCGYSCEATIS
jgi:hypothetical protein